MRKLIYTANISIDGYMEDADGGAIGVINLPALGETVGPESEQAQDRNTDDRRKQLVAGTGAGEDAHRDEQRPEQEHPGVADQHHAEHRASPDPVH